MATHKSAIKRIRQNEVRRRRNRMRKKILRAAVKALRISTDKEKSAEQLPRTVAVLDRMARRKIIHPNKAANMKSKLARRINRLSAETST